MKSTLILGMPRSGNHLVMTLLNKLGYIANENNDFNLNISEENNFLFTYHVAFNELNYKKFLDKKIKGIYVNRDKKQSIISYHLKFNTTLLKATEYFFSMYKYSHLWSNQQNICNIEYNDLAQLNGKEKQKEAVKKICFFLDINTTEEQVDNLLDVIITNETYPQYYGELRTINVDDYWTADVESAYKLWNKN